MKDEEIKQMHVEVGVQMVDKDGNKTVGLEFSVRPFTDEFIAEVRRNHLEDRVDKIIEAVGALIDGEDWNTEISSLVMKNPPVLECIEYVAGKFYGLVKQGLDDAIAGKNSV